MSIKKMVIESLKDLRKVMKLTPEAEKLLEKNPSGSKVTRPHYYINIDGENYELGKLNLYSASFLFQVDYDCETGHIKGENIIVGWKWR